MSPRALTKVQSECVGVAREMARMCNGEMGALAALAGGVGGGVGACAKKQLIWVGGRDGTKEFDEAL